MFVGDEVILDVTFPAVRSGLARLAPAGLLRMSQDAYRHGHPGPERAGPPRPPVLTGVQARPVTRGGARADRPIRWEAARPGREPHVVLDADLGLMADGAHGTLLTLSGVYRASAGEAADRAVLPQIAASTVRNFLSLAAASIFSHPGPAPAGLAESAPRPPGWVPERA